MAEIKTLRALGNQMRAAAGNLAYDFGTGLNGEVLFLGRWPWNTDNPSKQLPELPALLRDATPRQRRDHRFAESLAREQPAALLKTLLACRQVIGEVVQGEIDLRTEGYTDKALEKQRIKLGNTLLDGIGGVLGGAANAARRLSEVRRTLAAEHFEAGDADRYLKSLGLEGGIEAADSQSDIDSPARETQIAVQTAIFDAEIARALKPLSPADRTMLLDGRTLPKQVDDPRVLAAVFRAPQVLLPFDADEMRAIAALAFARNWPKTAATAGVVEAMIEQVRPVAGMAMYMIGRIVDPVNPYDTFRRVPGGRWALEPMVGQHGPQARSVYDDLMAYSLPT